MGTREEAARHSIDRLIAAARQAFAAQGYTDASMDALCASAGLTRGALYHHFGGKKGLLDAVVLQIDREIGERLWAEHARHDEPWTAFKATCAAYLSMALEPEIQRVYLRDANAVLGGRLREIDAGSSLGASIELVQDLMARHLLPQTDPETLARLVNGALLEAALWIAESPDPPSTHHRALAGLDALLEGLRAGAGALR